MGTVADKLAYLNDTKTAIKEALIEKGVDVKKTDSFRSYASKIANIEGGNNQKYGITLESILGKNVNGVLQAPTDSTTIDFTGVVEIGYQALKRRFNGFPPSFTTALFPTTKIIRAEGLIHAFSGSAFETFDVSAIETVDAYGMYWTFHSIPIKTCNFQSLKTVGEAGLRDCFYQCTQLTSVLIPNLESVGLIGMYWMFEGCTSLPTMTFDKLVNIGSEGLGYAFDGCTSLKSVYFPALKSTSFGGYTNQFTHMLQGVTGCTVHFPSNLQAVIGQWSDVLNGFNGTNTTILFDLAATE